MRWCFLKSLQRDFDRRGSRTETEVKAIPTSEGTALSLYRAFLVPCRLPPKLSPGSCLFTSYLNRRRVIFVRAHLLTLPALFPHSW